MEIFCNLLYAASPSSGPELFALPVPVTLPGQTDRVLVSVRVLHHEVYPLFICVIGELFVEVRELRDPFEVLSDEIDPSFWRVP